MKTFTKDAEAYFAVQDAQTDSEEAAPTEIDPQMLEEFRVRQEAAKKAGQPGQKPIDCKDSIDCLVDSSKNCRPTKVTVKSTRGGEKSATYTLTTLVETKGVIDDKCNIFVKTLAVSDLPADVSVDDLSPKSLVGKSGTCKASNSYAENGTLQEFQNLKETLGDLRNGVFFGDILSWSTGYLQINSQCEGNYFEL